MEFESQTEDPRLTAAAAFEAARAEEEPTYGGAHKVGETDDGRISLYDVEIPQTEELNDAVDLRTISAAFSEAAGFEPEPVSRRNAVISEPEPVEEPASVSWQSAGSANMDAYTEDTTEESEFYFEEHEQAAPESGKGSLAATILPMVGDAPKVLLKKGIIIVSVIVILVCLIALAINSTRTSGVVSFEPSHLPEAAAAVLTMSPATLI